MKKLCILCATGILLVSCSKKEKLKGERVNLSLTEEVVTPYQDDNTPVTLDKVAANNACTQPFYNASHSYAPLEISMDLKKLWETRLEFETTPALRVAAVPVIAEDKLFCTDAAGILYAIDTKNGKIVWRKSTTLKNKDGQIGGALAYTDGKIIANTSFSESIAFDAQTGDIVWRIKLPAPAKGDGITIHDGKAFMACSNSCVCVIDIKTGKQLWTHYGMSSETIYTGSAGVAIHNNTAYVVYPSGEIFALLTENGSVLWEASAPRSTLAEVKIYPYPRACPVVKDGLLYIVAAGHTVAYDINNGNQVWTCACGSLQTPIVSGNSIFICNTDSELVCLNRLNGHKRWIVKLDTDVKLISDWYAQLLIADHIVTISPNGHLKLIDPRDGTITQKKNLWNSEDAISLNPVVADGIMYIQQNDGRIAAYK